MYNKKNMLENIEKRLPWAGHKVMNGQNFIFQNPEGKSPSGKSKNEV